MFKVRFVLIGFMYVFLSVNSAFSQGWGVQEERPPIRFEYDNSSYSLSDYEIKVAILNVIIENRWQVVTQEKSKILKKISNFPYIPIFSFNLGENPKRNERIKMEKHTALSPSCPWMQ